MNFVVVGKAQLSSYVVAHDSGITVTARPMRREERVVQDAVVLVGRTIFTSPTTSPSAEISGRQAARQERPLVGAFRYLLRATGADDAVTGVEVGAQYDGLPARGRRLQTRDHLGDDPRVCAAKSETKTVIGPRRLPL